MSFRMRVGGQSGTAIRSTTSSAEAESAPAPPISAAVAVAPASTASFLTQVMFRFPPDALLVLSSSGVQGLAQRKAGARSEDMDLAGVDDDGHGIAGLQADGLGLGEDHAQHLARRRERDHGDITERLDEMDGCVEAAVPRAGEADVARPDPEHRPLARLGGVRAQRQRAERRLEAMAVLPHDGFDEVDRRRADLAGDVEV